MTTTTRIFFTGATGYIGGSVLTKLLIHPDIAFIKITALVRSPEKAEKLRQLGVNVVVGSLEDAVLLEKLASEADIVINTADSDDLLAARTILRGLRQTYSATGVAPIAIHTSGAGVLCDNAVGMYAYDTIWDDTDPDRIETLPPTQVHRIVDLEFINADKEGYVKAYVVVPAVVYGIATGKLVELGIQNPYSILVPQHICASLDRGQGGMIGEGKNYWPNVHIDELADLYLVLYNAIKISPRTGHGREGIYFAENGEHTLYELSKEISKVLKQIGRGKTDEPTSFTHEEITKYLGGSLFQGANSRCRGNRSRAIGWKPSKTTSDLLASVEPEVEYLSKLNPMAVLDRYNEYLLSVMRKYNNV